MKRRQINSLRKHFPILLLIAVLTLFSGCELFQPEPDLDDIVNDMNRKCPMMIDSETRLDKISVDDPSFLSYHYSLVNIEASRVDTHQFRLAMWPGLLSTIRLSPEMQKLREEEVTIRYYYNDKNQEPISVFVFAPADYK